jgi:hypothetical protein
MINTCVICFDEIGEWDNRTLCCGHTFHDTCISEWFLYGKLECPVCRHPIPRILVDISEMDILAEIANGIDQMFFSTKIFLCGALGMYIFWKY